MTRKTGKLSRQRLALYIISALVVLAMAVGVIVSAFAPAPVTQGVPTTETPIAEPAADEQATPAEKESTAEATVESSSATEEPNAEN